MKNNEIRERIFEGIRGVFDFYSKVNLETGHFIRPEYLLTVKIAESIATGNSAHKIKLEEKTADFANACVSIYRDGFSYQKNNVNRNGRVDIAVYSNEPNTDTILIKLYFL